MSERKINKKYFQSQARLDLDIAKFFSVSLFDDMDFTRYFFNMSILNITIPNMIYFDQHYQD